MLENKLGLGSWGRGSKQIRNSRTKYITWNQYRNRIQPNRFILLIQTAEKFFEDTRSQSGSDTQTVGRKAKTEFDSQMKRIKFFFAARYFLAKFCL